MANEEHLARLKEDVAVWNTWRAAHPEIRPDLSQANLSQADLIAADLSHVALIGADLIHTLQLHFYSSAERHPLCRAFLSVNCQETSPLL